MQQWLVAALWVVPALLFVSGMIFTIGAGNLGMAALGIGLIFYLFVPPLLIGVGLNVWSWMLRERQPKLSWWLHFIGLILAAALIFAYHAWGTDSPELTSSLRVVVLAFMVLAAAARRLVGFTGAVAPLIIIIVTGLSLSNIQSLTSPRTYEPVRATLVSVGDARCPESITGSIEHPASMKFIQRDPVYRGIGGEEFRLLPVLPRYYHYVSWLSNDDRTEYIREDKIGSQSIKVSAFPNVVVSLELLKQTEFGLPAWPDVPSNPVCQGRFESL